MLVRLFTILFIYINACTGYTPIYSSSNFNFKIEDYSLKGEERLANLIYRKLYNIESPLTLIGPPNLADYLTSCFHHLGINSVQDLDIINIEENMELQLGENFNLCAMEMKHKIPCWGYAMQSGNKKLVFVTDTLRNTNTIKLAQEADVLIHEATFQHAQRDKAKKHFHTTEIQAMEIADSAKVKRLILTHFSQRLTDTDVKKWIWRGQPCVVFDERQKI